MSAPALSSVANQVMWNRLISVVEEQARALVRTAFSTSVREAGDLSAGVYDLAGRMLALGCHEISLGDTIGVGTPGQARAMVEAVAEQVPRERLALHFHDTYGQALANIFACLERGVAVIDSAVAGLGGCPYASGAAGNVASEDVLYMLDGLGIETGVDLDRLAAAGRFICAALDRPPVSRVARALAARGATEAEGADPEGADD